MRILAVDDSRAIHRFLDECFQGTVYKLEHVFHGQEAIQRLRALPGHFDLILLDWEMPVMTGPETLAALRKDGIQVPVIMLTSKNAVSDITQMLSAGVSEYVMKPFTSDIILEKVEAITGKGKRADGVAA